MPVFQFTRHSSVQYKIQYGAALEYIPAKIGSITCNTIQYNVYNTIQLKLAIYFGALKPDALQKTVQYGSVPSCNALQATSCVFETLLPQGGHTIVQTIWDVWQFAL